MLDPKLTTLLRCPIDGGKLTQADDSLIQRINQSIRRGEVRDRHDQKILQPIEGGLITIGGGRIYPIRGGIPTLIADEAILVQT